MKSYDEIKEILLRDYPKYFDILDLDMQIRGLFGVKPENYKEQLDRNLDNYMDCSKRVADNEGLRDHDWLKQEYGRLLNIYNDIKNTYKEADNMNLYESIKKNLKESVKVGPIYKLGTEDYITSYNDIRLDEVGITLEDIELFKRVDTSESAPDKVNYLLYVDMRWDGDDTMTVPVAYNISDNEYEEEINPPMLGIYDEDLDSEVYSAVDEVIRNLALKISQSGSLTESTETRLANLGVKGKKPELKTVVLDGKEMMDYLKNDMEGKFPEFEKQITDDDHMIYFLTDLDKGKWDFDKMRIEEKVDSICPVCGDHHRFVKEENGKRYYSCPLCKYEEDEDNIYEAAKHK